MNDWWIRIGIIVVFLLLIFGVIWSTRAMIREKRVYKKSIDQYYFLLKDEYREFQLRAIYDMFTEEFLTKDGKFKDTVFIQDVKYIFDTITARLLTIKHLKNK